jgi:hypothetical protein
VVACPLTFGFSGQPVHGREVSLVHSETTPVSGPPEGRSAGSAVPLVDPVEELLVVVGPLADGDSAELWEIPADSAPAPRTRYRTAPRPAIGGRADWARHQTDAARAGFLVRDAARADGHLAVRAGV